MNAISRPLIFGILNVTADLFSDGGRYLSPEAALSHAADLMTGGADAIDIGAAASNIAAVSIAPEVEIARLAPLVAESQRRDWPVSIDSFSPEVQLWALAQEVAYLNDIHGFPAPALYPRLAVAGDTKLIVMHAVQDAGRATRIDTDPATIRRRIEDFFDARIGALVAAGIERSRIILDPGMGHFLGADPEVSLTVLQSLSLLRVRYDLPVMVSVSRKSFLRALVGRSAAETGAATVVAELFAAFHGADMIRTHDPAALTDALTIWSRVFGQN